VRKTVGAAEIWTGNTKYTIFRLYSPVLLLFTNQNNPKMSESNYSCILCKLHVHHEDWKQTGAPHISSTWSIGMYTKPPSKVYGPNMNFFSEKIQDIWLVNIYNFQT
jgi:hypothetical protein